MVRAIVVGLVLLFSTPAWAMLVDGPEIDGMGTFFDETGRQWVDLDVLFDTHYSKILAAGFTVARSDDVFKMMGDTDAITIENFNTFASIMGSTTYVGWLPEYNGLKTIWGGYYDLHYGPDGQPNDGSPGYIFAIETASGWRYADDLPWRSGGNFGVFAYRDIAPTPEPGTFVMLGLGLLGLSHYVRPRSI